MDTINKAGKLSVLSSKVLDDLDIVNLRYDELQKILEFIDNNIITFINDSNNELQDLLNLFSQYLINMLEKDENQAFTQELICKFMYKALGVNNNLRILDMCSGLRVIVVIEENSYVNIRSLILLVKFKT